MKWRITVWFLGLLGCCLAAADDRLQLLPAENPPCVFGGNTQKLTFLLYNAAKENFNSQIHARILQTSSALAVPFGEMCWKTIQVLPRQTVLESAQLNPPAVKAETEFIIQWLDRTNHLIGAMPVFVYPTNLFEVLRPLLSRTNFGIFDPGNQMRPLLEAQGISFVDLGEINLENFSGRLAVIGPFPSNASVPQRLADQIKVLAKKNIAVVWIQPPELQQPLTTLDWEREKILPSFYCVRKCQTAVVVVQPELVADLSENPRSQIALIYFCKLALNPQPAILPGFASNTDP